MANKRDIKKQIHAICGELALNCIVTRDCIKGIDQSKMDDVIVKIARLQSHALQNLTFNFDKVRADFPGKAEYNKASHKYFKAAYKSFTSEFNKSIQEIVNDINALLPHAQKELNKEAAKK